MMKMKNLKQFNFKLQALLLCGICSCGIFSSCSKEDIGNKTGSAIGNQLVLTINTANPNSPQASALPNTLKNVKIGSRATVETTSGITTAASENQINRLTIGIFDKDKNLRILKEFTTGDGTGSTFKLDNSKAIATITTTSDMVGNDVLVAVNAVANAFSTVTNEAGFNAVSEGIDRALATSWDDTNAKDANISTKEEINNIPMYGSSSTSGSTKITTDAGSGNLSATINVQHQLAKITVKSIKVNFSQTGAYKSATFQPTAFFLINVANDLTFSDNAWNAAATAASSTYPANQGYSSTATDVPTGGLTTFPYKDYLTTGTFSSAYPALKYLATDATGTAGGTTDANNITPNNVFYVTPNVNTTQNTKLVIEGQFDPDGNGSNAPATTVFYPVSINSTNNSSTTPDVTTTAKAVYPNKNYICEIIINTKGSTSPYNAIDPAAATVTVTVSPFTPVNQSTVFE